MSFSEYTLFKGKIGWTAFIICEPGYDWRFGGPRFWALTRRGAIRRAEREIDRLNAQAGYTTRFKR